ncbi:MAG TPA: Na(+)/H(+) antiporter subunit C [Anaerolineae bacterium]|nr:Na(+)/H(+) antiporter subunit C [Anaerolineae bacterium]HOQ98545.1 Na(+)/H(+) antiporter subunit C [Anaerolineae bacterium]HPL27047.1 Na(+)/H(+) antiporter subunit C [Anaerolineae bacterium]
MTVVMAIVVGALFAAGTYLLLRRSAVHIIIGLALLGHATNLFVFAMGWLRQGGVPLIGSGPTSQMADPLPQALILTAIVIGFATQAFVLILSYRAHEETGTDDLDQMKAEDPS